ncbi:MAG: 3-deoxy-manno-octulosonate cytidylyltransferase [Marinilabiliales bacterium]
MKFIAIIPARYGSTRLEGKPLIDINGKPMIQHVYEKAKKVIDDVYVATDDTRIVDAVNNFGGNAILTATSHKNGTSRCFEAYQKIKNKFIENIDFIINIQGDEPMLDPVQLQDLMKGCNKKTEIATLIKRVTNPEDLKNPSECFVVFTKNNLALYFSRSVIPFLRNYPFEEWIKQHDYYKHIGIYAYSPSALEEFCNLEPTSLEIAESLEQNRWLENGHTINVCETSVETIPVDTEEDLQRVRKLLQ